MSKLRLLSWNVNGLRAVHRKGMFYPIFDLNPDIVCLQETKAHEDQLSMDLRFMNGYYSYFSAPSKKGYSGVGIYTKEQPLEVTFTSGIDMWDSEGRVIHASYPSFELLNVYFPNGKASDIRLEYKMGFYAWFLEYVQTLVSQGKNVIFCGDVNTAHTEIDLSRPKENSTTSGFLPEEREWINTVVSHGFIDSFRYLNKDPEWYTWWDVKTNSRLRNVGWRIDYVFLSQSLLPKLVSATILREIHGSDHCPVEVTLAIK